MRPFISSCVFSLPSAYTANDPVNNTDPTGNSAVHALRFAGRQSWRIGQAIGKNKTVLNACAKSAACRTAAIAVFEASQDIGNFIDGVFANEESGPLNPGPLETDPDTGKITDIPEPGEIGDDEIEDALAQLKLGNELREFDNDRDPGNPNGDDGDKNKNKQKKGHQERIDRENALKDALTKRLEKLYQQ